MMNHNVQTCKMKKEQTTMATIKTSSYACHICGLNGHKMIDCLKFAKIQNLFHGKFVVIAKLQHVIETQIITIDVNVVDVNVTIRSQVTEEHVFKDK